MNSILKTVESYRREYTHKKKKIKIKSSYFKLDNARSGYPVSRARGSCIMRSRIPGRIGI